MAPEQDQERARLALAAAVTELIRRRRLLIRLAAIAAIAVVALAVVLSLL